MEASMVFFALVVLAGALVVALLTMSAVANGKRQTDAVLRTQDTRIAELVKEQTRRYPDSLRAELDDLRGAIDVMRASHRKEFGALWGRLGGRAGAQGRIFDNTGELLAGDDELEAVIALQNAKPVQPNGSP